MENLIGLKAKSKLAILVLNINNIKYLNDIYNNSQTEKI